MKANTQLYEIETVYLNFFVLPRRKASTSS